MGDPWDDLNRCVNALAIALPESVHSNVAAHIADAQAERDALAAERDGLIGLNAKHLNEAISAAAERDRLREAIEAHKASVFGSAPEDAVRVDRALWSALTPPASPDTGEGV